MINHTVFSFGLIYYIVQKKKHIGLKTMQIVFLILFSISYETLSQTMSLFLVQKQPKLII